MVTANVMVEMTKTVLPRFNSVAPKTKTTIAAVVTVALPTAFV